MEIDSFLFDLLCNVGKHTKTKRGLRGCSKMLFLTKGKRETNYQDWLLEAISLPVACWLDLRGGVVSEKGMRIYPLVLGEENK